MFPVVNFYLSNLLIVLRAGSPSMENNARRVLANVEKQIIIEKTQQ